MSTPAHQYTSTRAACRRRTNAVRSAGSMITFTKEVQNKRGNALMGQTVR
jgi:hypothetical protein